MRLWGRETTRMTGTNDTEATGEAVTDVLGLAADRIGEIVGAAERAANEISAAAHERLRGAEVAGGQITRERIVAELSYALVQRADELRVEAGELADVLLRASARLSASDSQSAAVQGNAVPAPPERAVVSERPDLSARVSRRFSEARESGIEAGDADRAPFKPRARSARQKLDSPRASHDGLRLLATQMAVAGSSLEEIQERLQSEFGVDDPSSILANQRIPGSAS